jgi:nicotinate-nucleotide adenylyltransferase
VKLGVFGGSFDPPHLGHVRPVQEVRRRLELDRVLYVPTARPPHKTDPASVPEAPAVCRFAMVEMALLDEPGLFASPVEVRPDRTTYTVETLEQLRALHPDASLHLILGSDSLGGLATWRRWHDILRLARLAVLVRPGAEPEALYDRLPEELRARLDQDGLDLLEDLTFDVSSTEIRRRLAAGEPLGADWLHPRVLNYLEKYGFYR